jgi:hypothetical protein
MDTEQRISTTKYIVGGTSTSVLFIVLGVFDFLTSKPETSIPLVMSVVAAFGAAVIIAQVYIAKEKSKQKAAIVYSLQDLIVSVMAIMAIAAFVIPTVAQITQ